MKKIKSKTLVYLISIFLSILILFINERYFKALDNILYNMSLTFSITLLTTSIFSIVSSFFTNDIDTVASNNFSVLKCCQDMGLIGIYENFPFDNELIRNDFIKSKDVYIVMNDAKAFISSNNVLINERIQKNESTTFILEDYNQSDIMTVLTRKNGHSEDKDYYINKIQNVIKYHIAKLRRKNEKHKLKLYLNPNYNTLAIILTDNYALMSTYRYAQEKSKVPHFVFNKNGTEYSNIQKDILASIKLSTEYKNFNELSENAPE